MKLKGIKNINRTWAPQNGRIARPYKDRLANTLNDKQNNNLLNDVILKAPGQSMQKSECAKLK